MAAFDLQEQEQIAELKAWWSQWGKLLVTALLAVLIGYFGSMGWKHWQKSKGETAALAMAEVEKSFEAKDLAKTRAAADAMVKTQPDHALTSRAMLLTAKLAFDGEKLDDAKSALEWVVAHGKEAAVVDIARLRLAAVLLDQKQYDAALKLLDQPKSDSFAAQFAESRGDVLAFKGDAAGAKQAYQAALTAMQADSPAKNVLETKLSALGV